MFNSEVNQKIQASLKAQAKCTTFEILDLLVESETTTNVPCLSCKKTYS